MREHYCHVGVTFLGGKGGGGGEGGGHHFRNFTESAVMQ